jgi:hypothetical protein
VESLDYGDIDGICRAARMRNEWLRQCGLFAGSAVVEAGCEAVIGQRHPVFQGPWDPDHGRLVLRLARPVFPEIRPWTEDIVDARYDPRTKLLAAIYGEPQRRAVAVTRRSPSPLHDRPSAGSSR